MPKTMKRNALKRSTFPIIGKDLMIVPTRILIPGSAEIVRSGLSTLIVLMLDTLDLVPDREMMPPTTTMKSKTFHP